MARTSALTVILAGASCVVVAGGCADGNGSSQSGSSPASAQLAAAAGVVAEQYTKWISHVPGVTRPPVCAHPPHSTIGVNDAVSPTPVTFAVSTTRSGSGWIATVTVAGASEQTNFGHPSAETIYRWRVDLDKGHLAIC